MTTRIRATLSTIPQTKTTFRTPAMANTTKFFTSGETAQDMDVDTDSQWTFDVVMEDGESKGGNKDDITSDKYEIDSPLEIDPTPME
ncbi:hypothetical protein BGZ81_010621 [Podila clonocystis]|nr:hypothetical protein BGZ81_010621 [Podila clonocystis]